MRRRSGRVQATGTAIVHGPFAAHARMLDGLGCWLHLIGSVVRVEAHGSAATLVIELLVDAARGRRELVATAFRATGFHIIEVSPPLEALIEIDQSRLHLWAVVIGDTEIASRADELRRFLGESYPHVPLIVVGDGTPARDPTMINVDGIPDLALQVDNLVGMREQLGGMD